MTTAHSRRACRHRPAPRLRRTHWPRWNRLRFPRRATHRAAVLVLFSGPYARPDGIAAFLRRS
eukprot:81293-Prymnesium_polylepis.1